MRHFYQTQFGKVVISLVIAFAAIHAASGQNIPASERAALIALYNALGGDNWTDANGWKTAGNFSAAGTEDTWFGITISTVGTDLSVTAINLPNNNLNGNLPPEIEDLPNLTILNLANNEITGLLIPQLEQLSALEELNLSNNALRDSIPDWIGNFANLEVLKLGGNRLNDSIPASIGNLSNLRVLRLEFNRLVGPIPSTISNLTSLEELQVQANLLSGPIPAGFTSLSSLTTLNLSFNAFSASGAVLISFLNGLQANWQATQTVPPTGFAAQVLSAVRIQLTWNEVSYQDDPGGYMIRFGKRADALNDSLLIPAKDSTSVIISNLDSDSTYFFTIQTFTDPHDDNDGRVFSAPSATISARTLRRISQVERDALIALYNSTFGDDWTNKANWKDTLGNFKDPGLENTWFGVTINNLNDTLRVREIRLNGNNLKGTLPSELGNLSRLFLLQLNNNDITGTIPSSLGNLRQLTRLEIRNNRLTGPLAPELGGLNQVSILDLASNALAGNIPNQILSIPGGSLFDIRFNALFATDPAVASGINSKSTAFGWQNTQTVAPTNILVSNIRATSARISWTPVTYSADPGSYQLLVGSIPGIYTDTVTMGGKSVNQFDWTNLTPGTTYYVAVQTITFPHASNKNQVRSSPSQEFVIKTPALLPASERAALIAIYNQTQGDTWTNRSNWRLNPTTFNIEGSEGTWFGVTTTEVNGIAHVTELNLNANNLRGALPAEISNLTQLRVLRLNGNRLTGNIPGNINQLQQLETLRLDQNNLVGLVTNSMVDLPQLSSLNLRFNGLFTDNTAVRDLLTTLDATWAATQTVFPVNLRMEELTTTSTRILWDPIPFQTGDGGYLIRYGTAQNNYTDTVIVNNKNSSSVVISGLTPATTYFMRIQAISEPNANNLNRVVSSSSPEFQFFSLPPAPAQVTLTLPSNQTINQPLALQLRWQGMLGVQEYQVQLSTSINFATTVADVLVPNANGFNVDNLVNNTRYFWRVRARNAGGFGPWSETWEFRTILATPFIIAPENPTCTFTSPINFSWQVVNGATRYIFQISRNANFTDLVIDNQNVQSGSISISNIPPNASYWWRVRAATAGAEISDWSPSGRVSLFEQVSVSGPTTFCFGTAQATLTAPSGGTSYSWRRNGTVISGATSQIFEATESGDYTVQIGTAAGCVLISNVVTVTSFTIAKPTISLVGEGVLCQGESRLLTSSTANAYQWFRDGQLIQGATSQTFNVTQTGSYTVRTTSAQGCSDTSDPVTLRFDPLPTISLSGSSTVCQGQAVQMTASQGNAYQWFRNGIIIQGATQRNFFASEAGNYTVAVTVTNGCSATSEPVQINFVPLPGNIISPTGALNVCEGSSITLTAPDAQSFRWFRNGVEIPGAIARVLEVNQAGTYTVVSSNQTCSVTSQPAVVSLSVPPAASISFTGNLNLCEGQSRTLTATLGNTYQWFRNGIAINGATQRTFTATDAGAYTVRVANAQGCANTSEPVDITITPIPGNTITANGPLSFCEGGQVVLTSPTAATYQWFRNGTIIPNATGQTFVATQSGAYTVIATNPNTCAVTSSAINVSVEALPQAIITQAGPELRAPDGNFDYQWFRNGVPIAGATSRVFTTFTSGSYQVRLTSRTGQACSNLSPAFSLVITDLGNVSPELLFSAFPNPVRNNLQVRIAKTDQMQEPILQVYSTEGRILGTYTPTEMGDAYTADIDMSGFRQAQYLLVVRSRKTILRKWVIKH
jgi:Leucine-rich repeat (LRR) protein